MFIVDNTQMNIYWSFAWSLNGRSLWGISSLDYNDGSVNWGKSLYDSSMIDRSNAYSL